MHLKIGYSLKNLGWADCVVSDDVSQCKLSASYLTDALGNLLIGACAVLRYFNQVSFSFEEEPGEFRWVISSPRFDEIAVQIFEFRDLYSSSKESDGQLLFSTVCRPVVFATAVYAAAKAVLEEHGEDGYLLKWDQHPFPLLPLQELERLIALNPN
jgi:hypothetical protein